MQEEREEKKMMKNIRAGEKFAFDVVWVFGSSIVVLLLHFFQKPIMARYLGPDGLGLFSISLMIVGILELITLFGIDYALVKFVAEHKEDKEKVYSLISSALFTILIIGIMASLSLFLLSDALADIFDMPLLSSLLKIYAFAFSFSVLHGIIIGCFRGLREMKYYAFIRILQASLALMFILAFIIIGMGVKGAMLGTILAIITTVSIAMMIMKRFVRFTVSDYRKNVKMLLSFGSRMVSANMIGYVYLYIDAIMIGYFLTSTDVGYYEIATSLSKFFLLFPNAIGTVAYPTISAYWARGDIQAINKLVDKAMKYSSCVLTFAGMAIIFFAEEVITFIFSSKFLPAVIPLAILIIGTVISGTIRSLGAIFASVGRPDLTLKITTISAIINVFLNVILITPYGIIGAATATTTARVMFVIITVYLLRKVIAIKFDSFWYIKKGILIVASTVLFYILSPLNNYFSAVVALLFYIIFVMKYLLTREDINYFVSIAKRYGDFIKM